MIRNIALACFGFMCSLLSHAQNFEMVQVYYAADTFKLNNAQKHILDSVVENFSNRRIIINGHADYAGAESRNELIAGQRANAVLRYLVDRGFPETQVIHAIGEGQTGETLNNSSTIHKEDAASRRTDIFITKGPLIKKALKAIAQPDPPVVYKAVIVKNVTNIEYAKLKVGDLIILKNISFVPGTDTIVPESFDEIDNLLETLKANPTLVIRLEGHVCCGVSPNGYFEGTPFWDLSVSRALQVRNLLIKKGIDADRLTYTGFGRTHPIYEEEDTDAQKQVNRRVEIRIIKK
jgi:outer membrane protein OmpA-like peptidoglycan-associated protein